MKVSGVDGIYTSINYSYMLKFLGTKVSCTLGWPYTEGNWLYCDYFIWCVSCTVVVLTCFIKCRCAYVWILECVGVCMCGCFGNMCTCTCLLCCVLSVLCCVLSVLCCVLSVLCCVLSVLCCVLSVLCCVLSVLCLYCFFYVYLFLFVISVRTTAAEWKLDCSK